MKAYVFHAANVVVVVAAESIADAVFAILSAAQEVSDRQAAAERTGFIFVDDRINLHKLYDWTDLSPEDSIKLNLQGVFDLGGEDYSISTIAPRTTPTGNDEVDDDEYYPIKAE